jgi:transcriptional regulator with XRE-family HTH domain
MTNSDFQKIQHQRFAKLLSEMAENGVSQGEFARRVQVPPQYLSDVKSGRRPISELFARRVAAEFGVAYDWLLGESGALPPSESSLSASVSDSNKVWLPIVPYPVAGDPRQSSDWDGSWLEVAGIAAEQVGLAFDPYVLRFSAKDCLGVLKKNDLVLISQAIRTNAKLHVLKQGNRMFLARRRAGGQWEHVSRTEAIRKQEVEVAGHCVGILWRML